MQTLKIKVDIADISSKDADKLCDYISDYLVEHYNVVCVSFSVSDGE